MISKKVFSVGLIVLVLAILGVSAWFVLVKPVDSSADRVLTIAYLPSYHSLPLFVAVEKGLFEKEGLKVELQRIETPKDIIDGLVTGKIDATPPSAAAGITTIVESQNPGALKVYALNCSYEGQLITELLVPVDSEIKSIADLKGKKIAHVPGAQWATMTKKTLLVNGIDPKDVTLFELPFSNQLPALSSHTIDAVFSLEPTGTIGVNNHSAKILMRSPFETNFVNPWCAGAGVLSGKFVREQPALATKVVLVMKKAMEETETNPEHRKYLVQYLQLPENAVSSVELPAFYSVEDMNADILAAYQEFADVFFELNVTKKKIDVGDLMWNES